MSDPHVVKESPINIAKLARTALGARVCEMIWRYEKEMSAKRNCKYVAVRSRQQLITNGVIETIKIAVKRRPSAGFKYLIEQGRPADTYEWMALEDPRFKSLWEKASSRLLSHGVNRYPGYNRDRQLRKPTGRPPLMLA
jgi:hypothetical protein